MLWELFIIYDLSPAKSLRLVAGWFNFCLLAADAGYEMGKKKRRKQNDKYKSSSIVMLQLQKIMEKSNEPSMIF